MEKPMLTRDEVAAICPEISTPEKMHALEAALMAWLDAQFPDTPEHERARAWSGFLAITAGSIVGRDRARACGDERLAIEQVHNLAPLVLLTFTTAAVSAVVHTLAPKH
jgi:hypothetical protein